MRYAIKVYGVDGRVRVVAFDAWDKAVQFARAIHTDPQVARLHGIDYLTIERCIYNTEWTDAENQELCNAL